MKFRAAVVLVAGLLVASCTRTEVVGGTNSSVTETTSTATGDTDASSDAGGTTPDSTGDTAPSTPPETTTTTTTSTTTTTTTPVTTTTTPPADPPADDPSDVRYEFLTAPQLGYEPVRGTGCGADNSLGEVIRDGWWYGYAYQWGPSSFQFDVVCVYYGAEGQRRRGECSNDPEPDICFESGTDDFWVVNNNTRARSVPTDPNIEIYTPNPNCSADTIREYGGFSLIEIVGGRAIYLTTLCQGG